MASAEFVSVFVANMGPGFRRDDDWGGGVKRRGYHFSLAAVIALCVLQPAVAITSAASKRAPIVPSKPRSIAPPPTSAPLTARPISSADLDIANHLIPQDKFVLGNMIGFRMSFQQAQQKNPATLAVLSANPGLSEAMLNAAATKFQEILGAEYPSLRDSIAGAVATRLDPADYVAVARFLNSSAAQKMADAIFSQSGQQRVTDQVLTHAQPEIPTISRQDVAVIAAGAQRDALIAMTQDEIRAVAQFGVTPAGRRLALAQKDIGELSLKWVNALFATRMAEVNAEVMLAAKSYFEGKK